jgi:long-chain acyl-CoA synthetase
MTGNLAQILPATAQRRGDRSALKLGDAVTTFDGLDARSALVAGVLAEKGVSPGDRVGIMIPNVPDFAVAFFGALRAGAIVVPMNVQLKSREVEFYLGDSGARLMFAWHEVGDAALEGARAAGAEVIPVGPDPLGRSLHDGTPQRDVAERADDDTAVIIYTSGTTGTPKGAELTHVGLLKNNEILARDQLQLTEDDVVLGALPLFHLFGLQASMNTSVRYGACLTLIPRFDPGEALKIIERDRVTVFQGVPTMYHALLNHPERERFDTSSLRLCQSGGASLPVEVLKGFEEAFQCVLIEGYGLSETSPSASCNRPDMERKAGSVGPAVEGCEIRIVDDDGNEVPQGEIGEIVIRGHNVMKGYWNRPDATAEVMRGGWFHTGDIGRVDEDGYHYIVDRKKDLIIRGGYNVYPREIEEVLYEHPAVSEAAVVGVPDDRLGEEVGAAVALRPGQSVDAEDIKQFVRERVAAYKYPRRIWFVDALPKGATGKILKREIEVPEAALK